MCGNKLLYFAHFSSVFRASQLYAFLEGKKRCLIEQEVKHGLLWVKCSRKMICESYESRLSMTDTGGFSSTGYCCANTLSALRHAALRRWCTLDSLSWAVYNIPVCLALRVRRFFHSFPFRLNVKSQQGINLKGHFCCVIREGTECAKSLGFCCLRWMMDGYVGVAPVGSDARGDDSFMVEDIFTLIEGEKALSMK